MVKTTVLLLAGFLCPAMIFSQSPSDLFISEYVEGSSYNKYLEIFNGTGSPVDLSDYEIHVFTNGNGDLENPTYCVEMDGNLPDMTVFVVANSRADIYTNPNLLDGALNFNGDDAVCLYKISADKYVDVFGAVGVDPGDYWESGDLTTKDHSLIRSSFIYAGALIYDNENDFNTLGSEWEQSSKDDISNLGIHTIGGVTDIEKVREEDVLRINPNPVTDHLYVHSSKEILSIKILSFAGKEVLSQDRPAEEAVDVSKLSQGFYLLFVKFVDGTVGSLKFVKQ